jgi:hypothetical protein
VFSESINCLPWQRTQEACSILGGGRGKQGGKGRRLAGLGSQQLRGRPRQKAGSQSPWEGVLDVDIWKEFARRFCEAWRRA